MHFRSSVLAKTTIADRTIEVVIAVPSDFHFSAGQYVTITLPKLHNESVHEQFRDFSIASSPLRSGEIAIAFRASDSPFKTQLLESPHGATLEIDGPKGIFTLPETVDRSLVFLAGGIGITPFLSMLHYLTETRSLQRVTVLTMNHSQAESPYCQELRSLTTASHTMHLIEHIGRLTETELSEQVERHHDVIWYIAGPPAMVSSTQGTIEKFGISPGDIHIESFTGYA